MIYNLIHIPVAEVGCKPRVVPLRPGLSRHIPTSGLEDLPMSMCAQLYSTVYSQGAVSFTRSVSPVRGSDIILIYHFANIPTQSTQAVGSGVFFVTEVNGDVEV